MGKIYLRFTRNDKNFFSRAIQFCTHSKYSHVEFVTSEGYLAALPKGVGLKPFDYEPGCECIFAEVRCPNPKAVLDYARSQTGKPYDFLAIFSFLVRRDWKNPSSWFCSELVYQSFHEGGFPLLSDNIPMNRITPRDILLSPYVKIVDIKK